MQDLLYFAEGERFGNEFVDELGVTVAEAIEQTFGFLACEQFVGVLADDFREVGGEHGGLIDDRVAGGEGLRLESAGAIQRAATPKAGSRVAVPGSARRARVQS